MKFRHGDIPSIQSGNRSAEWVSTIVLSNINKAGVDAKEERILLKRY